MAVVNIVSTAPLKYQGGKRKISAVLCSRANWDETLVALVKGGLQNALLCSNRNNSQLQPRKG